MAKAVRVTSGFGSIRQGIESHTGKLVRREQQLEVSAKELRAFLLSAEDPAYTIEVSAKELRATSQPGLQTSPYHEVSAKELRDST